jgi:hypothetical protein
MPKNAFHRVPPGKSVPGWIKKYCLLQFPQEPATGTADAQ